MAQTLLGLLLFTLKMTNSLSPIATASATFAHYQVNYLLGDSGRSWLVGFGKQPDPIFQWTKLVTTLTWIGTLKWLRRSLLCLLSDLGLQGMRGAAAPYVEKGKLHFEGSVVLNVVLLTVY